MIYRLLYLSLITLVKLTFPDGVETLQSKRVIIILYYFIKKKLKFIF